MLCFTLHHYCTKPALLARKYSLLTSRHSSVDGSFAYREMMPPSGERANSLPCPTDPILRAAAQNADGALNLVLRDDG